MSTPTRSQRPKRPLADQDAAAARSYATALIGAAGDADVVERALEDLEAFQSEILDSNPRFAAILSSLQVARSEKDRILRDLLDGRVSEVALRFLRVLNRHDRLNLLSGVADEARRQWDRKQGRVAVHVRTAEPLDESQLDAVRRKAAALTSGVPVLQVAVDPDLIGGLVVQIGDVVLDASVRTRLEQIRKRLIEGNTHEISKRRDQFSHPA